MSNGLLLLEVISQIDGDDACILDLDFQIPLHVSQIILEESNGAFDLHPPTLTSYSCICGFACELCSSAADDSPQNWMLTLWLPGAGLRGLYAPTRIHIIPNTMSSSMPGGKTPTCLDEYFWFVVVTFE